MTPLLASVPLLSWGLSRDHLLIPSPRDSLKTTLSPGCPIKAEESSVSHTGLHTVSLFAFF